MSYDAHELRRLRSDLDIARSDLMTKDSEISCLQSDNYDHEKKIYDLETENSELKSKVSELEGACEICDHSAYGYGHCDSCDERMPSEPQYNEGMD